MTAESVSCQSKHRVKNDNREFNEFDSQRDCDRVNTFESATIVDVKTKNHVDEFVDMIVCVTKRDEKKKNEIHKRC